MVASLAGGSVKDAGTPPGENAGGCLWGRTTCHLCESGATADTYHFIAECTNPALERVRGQSFDTAISRILRWQREEAGQGTVIGGEEVDVIVSQAVVALKEAKLHGHTLPGQSLVYLATLGMPVAIGDVTAIAKGAGLPPSWVPLLEVPMGVSRSRQQQTVAARVLGAFASLALHVSELRNGKGAVAAAVVAIAVPAVAGVVEVLAAAGGGESAAQPLLVAQVESEGWGAL
jgi:hypothetical protein